MKHIRPALLCAAALLFILAGCAKNQETLETVVTAESIFQLEKYESLKTLDLSGSACYAEILDYIAAHPAVNVIYNVDFGGTGAQNSAVSITLAEGAYDYAALLENLAYLPAMKNVELPATTLTSEELAALYAAYPGVEFDYTVEIAGQEIASVDSQCDLSALTSKDVDAAAAALAKLPALGYVELTDKAGESALSMAEVARLESAAPQADFNYTFELFGQTLTTMDESVEYVETEIGNDGVDEIRQMLDIMCRCTYLKLEDCGVDSEVMAQLRDDYPDTKVVWRVYFGYFTCLTDEETIRAIFDLNDDNCHELMYCTDVKYMDIGHNSYLHDVSFIAYMPKLEICILSGSPFSDMTVFENHKELIFLELVWCGYVDDLTPLTSCTSLAYLNICYSQVTDLTPIVGLPLERFCYYTPQLTQEQMDEFEMLQPDCWVTFGGENPYVLGWRYNDQGYTWCDMYLRVREVFRYDENYYNHK